LYLPPPRRTPITRSRKRTRGQGSAAKAGAYPPSSDLVYEASVICGHGPRLPKLLKPSWNPLRGHAGRQQVRCGRHAQAWGVSSSPARAGRRPRCHRSIGAYPRPRSDWEGSRAPTALPTGALWVKPNIGAHLVTLGKIPRSIKRRPGKYLPGLRSVGTLY